MGTRTRTRGQHGRKDRFREVIRFSMDATWGDGASHHFMGWDRYRYLERRCGSRLPMLARHVLYLVNACMYGIINSPFTLPPTVSRSTPLFICRRRRRSPTLSAQIQAYSIVKQTHSQSPSKFSIFRISLANTAALRCAYGRD
jgi:hypothetical protein